MSKKHKREREAGGMRQWIGLGRFAAGALGAVIDEMSTIMAMQAEMAACLADHARSADANAESVKALVVATQIEDHIRQRQEHAIAALKTVAEAMRIQEQESLSGAGAAGTADTGLADYWSQRILEAQTLNDVRKVFAAALGIAGTPPGGNAKDARSKSGDAELF